MQHLAKLLAQEGGLDIGRLVSLLKGNPGKGFEKELSYSSEVPPSPRRACCVLTGDLTIAFSGPMATGQAQSTLGLSLLGCWGVSFAKVEI